MGAEAAALGGCAQAYHAFWMYSSRRRSLPGYRLIHVLIILLQTFVSSTLKTATRIPSSSRSTTVAACAATRVPV
eukprot:1402098-Rhodomonas_salina.3